MSSSIRLLVPLNVDGCGPIICTSCGMSGETCKRQAQTPNMSENVRKRCGSEILTNTNLPSAFMVRNRCSSDGLFWKNCSSAIVSSMATSSKTYVGLLIENKTVSPIVHTLDPSIGSEQCKFCRAI